MNQKTQEDGTELPCVMVVEDEPLLRSAVASLLELEGFQVVEAASGEEAVSLLSAGNTQIDLVFTDFHMPGTVDGIGLGAWVKQHCPTVPVIIASGQIGKGQIRDGQFPDLPFFTKPYSFDAVISRMKLELGHKVQGI